MNKHRVFQNLAIKMMMLGILIGLIFPFFTLSFGIDKSIVLSPGFFISCIAAGIIVAVCNFALVKLTVSKKIVGFKDSMDKVNDDIVEFSNAYSDNSVNIDKFFIKENSDDEFGEFAETFNNMVKKLVELLYFQKEHKKYVEVLSENLNRDSLSQYALKSIISYAKASGGAIFTQNENQLEFNYSYGLKDASELVNNSTVIDIFESNESKVIELPENVKLDGIVMEFSPKKLIAHSISYNDSSIGIILLAFSNDYESDFIKELDIFTSSLYLVIKNSIQHEQIEKLAITDSLTGIYNRRFGMAKFEAAYVTSSSTSVAMIDIDDFKSINDTYGHITGDNVIKEVVRIIKSISREDDISIRYGGEEFMLYFVNTSEQIAFEICEEIREKVSKNIIKYNSNDIKVTISIGFFTTESQNPIGTLQCIDNADKALYISKKSGKNITTKFRNIKS